MTNTITPPSWSDVPQLETTTIAKGGVGGPMNSQAVALTARTERLKDLNFETLYRNKG